MNTIIASVVSLLAFGCGSGGRVRPTVSPRQFFAIALLALAAAPDALAQTYTGVAQVFQGSSHTCALETGGTLRCWGNNAAGQLGVGTSLDSRSTPQAVTGLTGPLSRLSLGQSHTCAVDAGTLKCWGENNFGQLGLGDANLRTTPQVVPGIGTTTQVAAGTGHTCALDSAGDVRCWGRNGDGQLGRGAVYQSFNAEQLVPRATTRFTAGVAQLVAGGFHTCIVETPGSVKCWGRNTSGQIGVGAAASQSLPFNVIGFDGPVAQLALGTSHSCALEVSGGVKCWGNNSLGQLGQGSVPNQSSPRPVTGFSGQVTQLAAFGDHTCALESAGTVKCWGSNDRGRLGNGNELRQNTPQAVVGIGGGVTQLAGASDSSHTCVREAAGTVLCWGLGSGGQLGQGTTATSLTPLRVICPNCPPTCDVTSATGDCDGDGIPNSVETQQGTDPLAKDNALFAETDQGRRLFVMQVYRDLLGRESDAVGLTFWVGQLNAGVGRAQMVQAFLFTPESEATEAQAGRLYFAAFLRAPDPSGLKFWAAESQRSSFLAVADVFASSPEFLQRYGVLDNAGYIDRLYRNVLGRPADSGGASFWLSQMAAPSSLSRGAVLLRFANSNEYRVSINADVAVARLYIALLLRAPDDAGLTFWANRVEAGGSILDLITSFIGATEYRARFLP